MDTEERRVWLRQLTGLVGSEEVESGFEWQQSEPGSRQTPRHTEDHGHALGVPGELPGAFRPVIVSNPKRYLLANSCTEFGAFIFSLKTATQRNLARI